MDEGKIPFKQWVIIRHIRWLYWSWSFGQWWDRVGRHLGAFPNEADMKFLDDVWKGKS
jgi:hypothetical protein